MYQAQIVENIINYQNEFHEETISAFKSGNSSENSLQAFVFPPVCHWHQLKFWPLIVKG
jgi:hypothetical protein